MDFFLLNIIDISFSNYFFLLSHCNIMFVYFPLQAVTWRVSLPIIKKFFLGSNQDSTWHQHLYFLLLLEYDSPILITHFLSIAGSFFSFFFRKKEYLRSHLRKTLVFYWLTVKLENSFVIISKCFLYFFFFLKNKFFLLHFYFPITIFSIIWNDNNGPEASNLGRELVFSFPFHPLMKSERKDKKRLKNIFTRRARRFYDFLNRE